MSGLYHNNHAYRIRTAYIGDLLRLTRAGYQLCRETRDRRKVAVPAAEVRRMWDALPPHFNSYSHGNAQWDVYYIMHDTTLVGVISIWDDLIEFGLDYPPGTPLPAAAHQLYTEVLS